jgi:AraC-like DNA-binding protein
VSRLSDRHQIECFVAILVRICRQLTGLNLSPKSVRLVHRRAELPAGIKKVFGCNVAFASDADEVVYPRLTKGIATVNADPYLNSLLVRYCEEALSNRRLQSSAWRLKVENAIVPLLPHGQAKIREIAKRVGVSERTLMRLLASEGCTFTGILDALRFRSRQIVFARTRSAYFRSGVAFRLSRGRRFFSCLQTLDWHDTEATTIG